MCPMCSYNQTLAKTAVSPKSVAIWWANVGVDQGDNYSDNVIYNILFCPNFKVKEKWDSLLCIDLEEINWFGWYSPRKFIT